MGASTVLLFEDDPSTSDVLADMLNEAGHDVRVCGSPNQVMATAARMPRSLALMDFWGTSHRYLADHERRQVVRLARAVPTILVTGRPWANDRVAAELGCRAFVPKPFRPDHVSEVVAATVGDLRWAERICSASHDVGKSASARWTCNA
jgi:two-component system nitrogen regulation response regulator NtrX